MTNSVSFINKLTSMMGTGFEFETKVINKYSEYLKITTKHHINLEYEIVFFRGGIKSFLVNGNQVLNFVSNHEIDNEYTLINYMRFAETMIDLTTNAVKSMIEAF